MAVPITGLRAVQTRMEAARFEAEAAEARRRHAAPAGPGGAAGAPGSAVDAMRCERDEIAAHRRSAWAREATSRFADEAADMRERFERRRREEARRRREEGWDLEAEAHAEDASDLSRWLQEEIMGKPPAAPAATAAPAPLAAAAPSRASGAGRHASGEADEELGAEMHYLVDNSRLQAQAPGVTFRFSRHLDDRDEESQVVPWGSICRGCDAGDGWLKVGDRYLPMAVQGVATLVPCDEDGEPLGDAGDAQPAEEAPVDPVANPRAHWRHEEKRQLEAIRRAVAERQKEQLKAEAGQALQEKASQLMAARRALEDNLAERRGGGQDAGEEEEDHYSVLGLPRHATEEEITKAYRALAKLYHPDKAIDDDKASRLVRQQQMAKLSIAHKVLASPRRRWQYDRALAPARADAAAGAAAAGAAAAAAPAAARGAKPPRAAGPPARPPDASLPEDFDFSAEAAACRRAFGRAQRVCRDAGAMRRERVRLAMAQLRGQEEMKFGVSDEDTSRYGCEVVRHVGPYSPFAGLGEMGESHRLAQPGLRARLRDRVVAWARRALDSGALELAAGGLRYASLGSGELLFDLELIERLRHLGLPVAQVCLVDRSYRGAQANTRRALREFADWQRCAAQLLRHEPTEVLVFCSLGDYAEAAAAGGPAAGCHAFVHCDAAWPGAPADCGRLAALALAPGGLLAQLSEREADEEADLATASFHAAAAVADGFAGDAADAIPAEPRVQSLDDVLLREARPFGLRAWVAEAWPCGEGGRRGFRPFEHEGT